MKVIKLLLLILLKKKNLILYYLMNVIKVNIHLKYQDIKLNFLYKNCFYLDSNFKEFEDNYNLIKLVNKLKGILIVWVTYLPPGENHPYLIQNLIEKITRIKAIYDTINIILFGVLIIKRDEIEKN